MGIMRWLANLISPPIKGDENALWIYVRCARCGETISTRVDLRNDLSLKFGEEAGADTEDITYFCRKVLVGQERCYQRVEVELTFDQRRQLIDRQISGGEFIEEE
jgi:hypothetical protein